jgi:hypothetical protein
VITDYGLPSACLCGDCFHPLIGPNTDGGPCDFCRDCGCPNADHGRMTYIKSPESGTPMTNVCCACTSPAVALVVDGAHRKPVCNQHEHMYQQRGYRITHD